MDIRHCAQLLREHDKYLLVTHRRPDGDTTGTGAFLCRLLRAMGKTAHILKNPELTEKYAFQDNIKSVLYIASSSASTGSEFPEYAASKGGVVAYMKNVALRIAKYGATSNSISPGGVLTDLNKHIINSPDLWEKVMNEALLPKWASVEEIADWAYFVTVINKSMTAQDILIDNGEAAKSNFIW